MAKNKLQKQRHYLRGFFGEHNGFFYDQSNDVNPGRQWLTVQIENSLGKEGTLTISYHEFKMLQKQVQNIAETHHWE